MLFRSDGNRDRDADGDADGDAVLSEGLTGTFAVTRRAEAQQDTGVVIQWTMPWLCFKRLFASPVSFVMFQLSVNKSTPSFCTPSRDKRCLICL